jgi:hypothetical protein
MLRVARDQHVSQRERDAVALALPDAEVKRRMRKRKP